MRPVYRILLLIAACAGALALWWSRGTSAPKLVESLLPNFSTAQPPAIHFAVIGDNEGENPAYNALVQRIVADSAIQFVLHVGDATPTGSAEEFRALQALHARLGLTVPVYMVPGNHDVIADDSTRAWSTFVGERWRSVDIENLHLVLLDNAERKIGFPEAELDWLAQDLADWQARKPADGMTVLAYHRPFAYPLANLLGDDETRTSRASNERFLKILAQHTVDHIFTGHIHTALDYPMVISRDANDRVAKSVPVTVSGGGGQPIQTAFGGLLKEKFHALKVSTQAGELTTTVLTP